MCEREARSHRRSCGFFDEGFAGVPHAAALVEIVAGEATRTLQVDILLV